MDLTEGRSELQEVLPRVFITNFFGTKKAALLAQTGITHVLNVTWDLPFPGLPRDLVCTRVAFADNTHVRLPLNECLGWIEAALAAKPEAKVLVHCAAGSSRSGAIVVAWVMKQQRIRFVEALAFVQRIRSIVLPNPGFAEQLQEFEKQLAL